jgi:hypothetical protein
MKISCIKFYVISLLGLCLILSLLNAVTAHICHSSIINLTALFHFSQFIFYLIKFILIVSFFIFFKLSIFNILIIIIHNQDI